MAKIDLLAKAKALPPKQNSKNWLSKLPPDLQAEVIRMHVAFHKGELQKQFTSAADLSRWLIDELKLPLAYSTVAKLFAGEPDGPAR